MWLWGDLVHDGGGGAAFGEAEEGLAFGVVGGEIPAELGADPGGGVVDRLLATLVHLRHGATHDVLACWFGVDRSTITRAIGEVRPLLAARGCTIATGVRLRSLAEVIDHLGASGHTGIIDGTEIQVRRPAAGRRDREKFISGKNKQNAVKAMVLTDVDGMLLFCSPAQPASCADITHARQLGLVKHLISGPAVEILADAGYQGLGAQTGGRVVTQYQPAATA